MRLDELALEIGAHLDGDPSVEVTGVASIETATSSDLTFLANPKYRPLLASTRAIAIVVSPDEDAHGKNALRAKDPYWAFARALALFDKRDRPHPGVHPTAVIAATASVGEGAYIGPYAVVGENVIIGRGAKIFPHAVIYAGTRIGNRFTAHAGAVVREDVVIGDDVVLQPGAVIGGDGFGYLPRPGARPEAIPQVGTVVLGDAVEVGSNTTVDRAAVGVTQLEEGVKLDNLVMVAHGCRIGAGSLLAAQTGLAGSTVLGRDVMTGGQVGFAGHCSIGDRVRIAAQSGVSGDVPEGQTVGGSPAVEIGLWRRSVAALMRLPELFRRVRALEQSVDKAKPPKA